jgi:hypothetical protein
MRSESRQAELMESGLRSPPRTDLIVWRARDIDQSICLLGGYRQEMPERATSIARDDRPRARRWIPGGHALVRSRTARFCRDEVRPRSSSSCRLWVLSLSRSSRTQSLPPQTGPVGRLQYPPSRLAPLTERGQVTAVARACNRRSARLTDACKRRRTRHRSGRSAPTCSHGWPGTRSCRSCRCWLRGSRSGLVVPHSSTL